MFSVIIAGISSPIVTKERRICSGDSELQSGENDCLVVGQRGCKRALSNYRPAGGLAGRRAAQMPESDRQELADKLKQINTRVTRIAQKHHLANPVGPSSTLRPYWSNLAWATLNDSEPFTSRKATHDRWPMIAGRYGGSPIWRVVTRSTKPTVSPSRQVQSFVCKTLNQVKTLVSIRTVCPTCVW